MYLPKWRFMSLPEIKEDHKLNGGKTQLLTVFLDTIDDFNNRYFVGFNNETTQKSMVLLEKTFNSAQEGWDYIEELQRSPKYAVVYQAT